MVSGIVQSHFEEGIVPRGETARCIVVLVEFLAVSPTGSASACILHQLRFDVQELPLLLQDRQLARILQKNWAKRLAHRLRLGMH